MIGPCSQVADLEVVGREPDDLAVLEERDAGGVGRDGDGVAGQEVLALAQADDQRAAEPGADDLAGPRRG